MCGFSRQTWLCHGREAVLHRDARGPAAAHWPALLGAAVLSTLSLLLLSWAYARAEASYLAATEYTAFLWAALLGWLVFGEHLSGFTVAGAVLIVAGCLLAARSPQAANPHLEAAP